jgi:putative hydrolase of HD superfamily
MPTADNHRILQQMQFLVEVDKVKSIVRSGRILHGERYENDAEHSWHLALMAFVLAEHSNEPIDVLRVVKMVLIHDLVEIDAGDTFAYDEAALLTQREREVQAAERIFGLLPNDMAGELRGLWDEFEERQTPVARFAVALDRLCGVLASCHHQGGCWRDAGITVERVKNRNSVMEQGSAALWQYAEGLIDEALSQGFFNSAKLEATVYA